MLLFFLGLLFLDLSCGECNVMSLCSFCAALLMNMFILRVRQCLLIV